MRSRSWKFNGWHMCARWVYNIFFLAEFQGLLPKRICWRAARCLWTQIQSIAWWATGPVITWGKPAIEPHVLSRTLGFHPKSRQVTCWLFLSIAFECTETATREMQNEHTGTARRDSKYTTQGHILIRPVSLAIRSSMKSAAIDIQLRSTSLCCHWCESLRMIWCACVLSLCDATKCDCVMMPVGDASLASLRAEVRKGLPAGIHARTFSNSKPTALVTSWLRTHCHTRVRASVSMTSSCMRPRHQPSLPTVTCKLKPENLGHAKLKTKPPCHLHVAKWMLLQEED